MTIGGEKTFSSNLEVGTANFFVDTTTGNVGIGTVSPSAKLHISSGTSGDCVLKIEADTDNNNETDNPRIEFITDGGYNTALVGAGQMPFETANDNALVLAGLQMKLYTGVQDFNDSTGMIERVRILDNGNVGIGTTSPIVPLHVNGSINMTREDYTGGPALGFINPDGSYSGWFGFGSSTTNQMRVVSNNNYPITFWTNATGIGEEKMRVDSSGNVGIGTTNPEYALDVNGLASSKTSRVFEFSGSDNYARHFWICSFLDAPGYHTNQLIKINYSVTYKRLTGTHSRNSLASGTVTLSDLWRYSTDGNSGEFQYVTLQDQKNEQYGGQGALPKWYYVRFNNIGYLVLSVSVKGDSSSYYVKGNVDFLTRPSAESADRIFNGTVYKDSNIQQTEGFTSLSDLYPTTGTGVDGWDTTMTSESTAQNFIEATEGTVFKYGNVGIGTTSPGYKLDVNGSIKATSYLNTQVAFKSYTITSTSSATMALNTESVALSQSVTIPDEIDISTPFSIQFTWYWFGEVIGPSAGENFMFDIKVTPSGGSATRLGPARVGSRGYGISTFAINYWTEQASTPETATITGNVTYSSLSTRSLTVQLIGITVWNSNHTVYTNRTANDANGDTMERGITTLGCIFYK